LAVTQFVLASTSPRRLQILSDAGFNFEQIDPGDEGLVDCTEVDDVVSALATRKALAGLQQMPSSSALGVLGADTLVAVDGAVLTKPTDRDHAGEMMNLLSGRSHQVWTGAALVFADGRRFIRADCSEVEFMVFPEQSLGQYLAGEEWCDKAGAYGIQGWAGTWARLKSGSMENVIGIDPEAVFELLVQSDTCLPRSS